MKKKTGLKEIANFFSVDFNPTDNMMFQKSIKIDEKNII